MVGNELYCYRYRGDKNHRVMHSLVGTYIKCYPEEQQLGLPKAYSIKIVLPPNKSRILYFESEEE